jgi:pyrimidine-nucleoside phosphorylase
VLGYTEGAIPDYQASALLMAIYFRGLNRQETYVLTKAMQESGTVIDLSEIEGIKVDKHSTGGVGDKTTFIVAPIAAACGVPIAKMSGRGLGFTGGTVDKMESIPKFRTSLEKSEFVHLVNNIGMSVIGQTARIAPADKKIYELRDATATVENLSLITSSIMSKKLASGSDAIVLDVKCGKGAFLESFEQACELARLMVDIGKEDGKKTIGVITDMNQPLGRAVGNSLEVIESIETLKGNGPDDITVLSLALAGIMIYAGEKADSMQDGYDKAEAALANGSALEKFKEFIEGQGGDSVIINDYRHFPQAKHAVDVISEETGYVFELDARLVGFASQHAGAGRATKEDYIDMSAGIYLHKKIGDKVWVGETLATVYGNDAKKVNLAAEGLKKAFRISKAQPKAIDLIRQIII